MGMQGWRDSMEDSHIARFDIGEGVSFFGVYDGHGGAQVAIIVKKYLIHVLTCLKSFKEKDYKTALEETFMKMDEYLYTVDACKEVIAYSRNPGNYTKQGLAILVGCTATSVLITPDKIYCANSGDSRTVLSTDGECRPLSTDHKPDDAGELARITAAGGKVI